MSTAQESPDIVYGRLLEAAHLGGYAAERVASEFKWLLTDERWKQAAGGCDDIDKFLAAINLSQYRITVEDRKEIVKLLDSARATQRAAAKALGVSLGTINADVQNRTNGNGKQTKTQEIEGPDVQNRTEWFQAPPTEVTQPIQLQQKREQRRGEHKAKEVAELPRGRYALIYADPPWRYDYSLTENRAIENQYPTLSLDEICALPVTEIFADDCVLFLWATSPKLTEALTVMKAWGFTYKTCAVWDKEKIGMGYYFRQQHELLLVGTKGNPPVPEPTNRSSSVIRLSRTTHSTKPREIYSILEQMYPQFTDEHRRELFQREPQAGWPGWGNEHA